MRMLHGAALLVAMIAPTAAADQESFEFKGSGWVNTRDLHLDRLKGKVVLLHFYEEN